jgi:predicted amidohydrolase
LRPPICARLALCLISDRINIAILELRDEACEFRDSDGNTVPGKRRLITHLTLKDGRVLYERPAA